MAGPAEIERLEERRRLLVHESDRLRRQLAADAAGLQAAAAWVDTGYSVFQSVRGYWPLFAAGAGFFVARKRGGLLRSLGKLWTVWKVARRLVPLWRSVSAEKGRHHGSQAVD